MSSEPVIVHFEDVSKRYRRGGPGPSTFRREVGGWRVPSLGHGPQDKGKGPLALDHVSFGVRRGEAYALVGPNGAGKTTVLRILSGISRATSGRAWVDGRVAALLEVGAGLHPELSGRENIWLYGTILGLSRRQVRQHFEEIVDFGDLASALDRQVKYYSSGMQLRLGFSIAAVLDPDVLIVDEALAVGDLNFQAKCTSRMAGMLAAGTTLLYVSHTLASVNELCSRAALLDGGRLIKEGTSQEVIAAYVANVVGRGSESEGVEICGAVLGRDGSDSGPVAAEIPGTVVPGGALMISVDFVAARALEPVRLGFQIADQAGRPLMELAHAEPTTLSAGMHCVGCRVGSLPLSPGIYQVFLVINEEESGPRRVQRPVGAIVVDGPQPAPGRRPAGPVWGEFDLTLDDRVVPC